MQAQAWARDHVPALTALLSVVALAFVFGAALQVLPVDGLPQPASLLAAIPHLNAGISAVAIGTIAAGVRAVRNGRVQTHRRLMLTSFGLFSAFLVLYLYRVAVRGPTEFTGPSVLETFVYLPVLAVHIVLAVVCVPFVFYALLLAGTHSIDELPETKHRFVGRVAASLWVISFSMGLVIYAMLYVLF
ncbi:MAG: DUF420 domain-containing protein [Natronomonas sp.]